MAARPSDPSIETHDLPHAREDAREDDPSRDTPASLPLPLPLLLMPRPLLPGQPVPGPDREWIDEQARAARDGDPAACEALWIALQPRFDLWARRLTDPRTGDKGPLRDGRPWVRDDLRQEGFAVLLAVLASWNRPDGFFYYLLKAGPMRMRGAMRALRGPAPLQLISDLGYFPDLADDSAAAAEVHALIAALAAGMEAQDGALLVACVVDGRSVAAAGRWLGFGRRETQRRFDRIRAHLRATLDPDRPGSR